MNVFIWAGIGLLSVLLVFGLLVWRRRRQLGPRLRRVLVLNSDARLRDVLVPDGLDGKIHIDHLLRTAAGFVVVDVIKVDGAVFGGERIDEWTTLVRGRSHKFRNPVAVNRQRVLAASALVPGVPVHGLVVLLGEVAFPKGTPPGVATLETLPTALAALPRAQPPAHVSVDDAWIGLAASAQDQ